MVADTVSRELALNYHLMHPGAESAPGDPNVAFYLEGEYHLHYILRHQWHGKNSYSFVHVVSPDMLHWNWKETTLQPSFTGHGMFSGTGFMTTDGRPAAIYAGLSDPPHSYIAIARDNRLQSWEKPFPVLPKGGPDGEDVMLIHDPDCFRIGDTYYAFSAIGNLPLCKSTDLRNWMYVGPFMKHDMPDVAIGEDVSCANFFPMDGRWVLLCISHSMGCRTYIGDWDAANEQFVPESHRRMNWRRPGQSLIDPVHRDFFAPESVLTPDGRRVMWAWLCTLHPEIDLRTVQSLPRELRLDDHGSLRINPLTELASLRYDSVTLKDVEVPAHRAAEGSGAQSSFIADLKGDSFEIRINVERREAERMRFGFQLFSGDSNDGLLVLVRPETGTICVGATEAPFAVADLPPEEDFELRIFVDKYLVEVFANGRQAAVCAYMEYREGSVLRGYSYGGRSSIPLKIRNVDIWKLKPTNQGFMDALESRIWTPDTD